MRVERMGEVQWFWDGQAMHYFLSGVHKDTDEFLEWVKQQQHRYATASAEPSEKDRHGRRTF